MDVAQAWMIVGVPVLVVALALFAGRSQRRAWFGYALLAGLVVFLVTVPGDVVGAAVPGILLVGLVASGRGTYRDEGQREHHQDRKRLTTARDGGDGAP
ncbi:MAG: hypothetical protein KG028_15210 [Actinobacteria bacterium]|jgi:hypothetical protein|nr:hypothetical protein [Actinomycetota bacterium]